MPAIDRALSDCRYAAGDGLAEASKIGPMVSTLQRDMVAAQVDAAVAGGARIVAQASVPEAGGNFFPATVLSGLAHESAINAVETFGPLVALCSFDGSEAEAVRFANDTEYGLAAYVYSQGPPTGISSVQTFNLGVFLRSLLRRHRKGQPCGDGDQRWAGRHFLIISHHFSSFFIIFSSFLVWRWGSTLGRSASTTGA